MMQEDTENKMFKELLGDYAAPAKDDGFSKAVLSALPAPRNTGRIKSLMVGGAGALGAILAGSQLPGLWTMVSGVKIPGLERLQQINRVEAPAVDLGILNSTYGVWALVFMVLLTLWTLQAVWLGDEG